MDNTENTLGGSHHKPLVNLAIVISVISIFGLFALIYISKENANTKDAQLIEARTALTSCQERLKEGQSTETRCEEQYDPSLERGKTTGPKILQTFEFQGLKYNVIESTTNSIEPSGFMFNFYIDSPPNVSSSIVNTPIGVANRNYGTEGLIAISGNRLYVIDANDIAIKIYELVDLALSEYGGPDVDGGPYYSFRLVDTVIIPQNEYYPPHYIECNQTSCQIYTARHVEAGCTYTMDIKTLEITPKYKCETPRTDMAY